MSLEDVAVIPLRPERFGDVLSSDGLAQFEDTIARGRDRRPGVLRLDQAPAQPPARLRRRRRSAQVSRWDRLKDPVGVLAAFAEHIHAEDDEPHLLLAGPDVKAVSDDP